MKKRLVRTLKALDESGRPETIQVFRDVIETSNMRDGRSEALGGLQEAFTSDGRALNYIDEKTFEVVQSGEKLHVI
jgi:hypothetical protein